MIDRNRVKLEINRLIYKFKNIWFNLVMRMKRKWRGADKQKLLRSFFVGLLVLIIGMLVITMAVFAWFAKDLPTPEAVVRREGYSSRVYDRNGKVLYDLFKDEKRLPVVWTDVPEYLKKATIAIEDKSFYQHKGFDPLTPLRIGYNLIFRGRLIGGSTLTQQLVKNVLLTSERSVIRKIKEFILAVQIEQKYTKDEILLMYLNEAPYGGPIWGVGPATERYFGKSVGEINLAESVILAGIPQRPPVFSPYSSTPKAYVSRSKDVLARMREDGYISQDLADKTLIEIENYQFKDKNSDIKAPHFVFWIREQLVERYGEEVVSGSGLQITTSLDLDIQERAEEIVAEEIEKAKNMDISNGAALVIDPRDGQVLAMVGSKDYFSTEIDGQFNVASQALRQPGSAIKPITYLAGLKTGMTPATMIVDSPVVFPGVAGQKDYEPKNYSGKYNGPMSLRSALANSINTTAVKVLARVGVKEMLNLAHSMGITTLEPSQENLSRFGLAVTLGGADVKMTELSSAYASFANGGKKIDLQPILKVEDRNGRVLEEYKPINLKQVILAQEAFLISHILSDNEARSITFGAVSGLIVPGYQVAVKTGTTNDKRDNWAIGWTPNLLTTVWVGNNDNSPMGKVASGVSGATPIWQRIMKELVAKREKQDFSIPPGIISLEVDKISGYKAHDGFPARAEYFVQGTESDLDDPIHAKLKVCRNGNGLAPPEDVIGGNYDEKEFIKLREDDPISTDGKNRWQEGINWWISQQTDQAKYNPPEGYCREDGGVGVRFTSPGNQSTVGKSFDVKMETTSLAKITQVELWVNGKSTKVWTERPFETRLELEDGLYELKVKATNKDNQSGENNVKIGVNLPWNWSPSPTLTPTLTPIPTVLITPTILPTLMPTGVPTVTGVGSS